MFLPAVAKYGWIRTAGSHIDVVPPPPRGRSPGPASSERAVPCNQRLPPLDLLTGSSTAKVDDVPGVRVPNPSTKRPFSGRDRAGSVVGELQRRPPSSMPCMMTYERGPAIESMVPREVLPPRPEGYLSLLLRRDGYPRRFSSLQS